MRKISFLFLILIVFLAACDSADKEAKIMAEEEPYFFFKSYERGVLLETHFLKYELIAGENLSRTGPTLFFVLNGQGLMSSSIFNQNKDTAAVRLLWEDPRKFWHFSPGGGLMFYDYLIPSDLVKKYEDPAAKSLSLIDPYGFFRLKDISDSVRRKYEDAAARQLSSSNFFLLRQNGRISSKVFKKYKEEKKSGLSPEQIHHYKRMRVW